MSTDSSSPDHSNENSLSSMADRTFTCFPKLPLELRNMIWDCAANLPRNLDIWAPTIGNEMVILWNQADGPINFTPYKFCSTRPVPGILHANQESRTTALGFYELSFHTKIDVTDHIKIVTSNRIYCNPEADQICPMGPYGYEAISDIWYSGETGACAFNIHESWRKPMYSEESLIDMLGGFTCREEILLYYCKELFPSAGLFEFVELNQVQATPEAWDLLDDVRNRILQCQEDFRKLGKEGQREGEEDPEDCDTCYFPSVKLVALVVDGVQQ
ncbi:hypothetical protein LOCC1_G006916 [Lachnellula occidentalis]|uniref:2EXR domain-containing protein n=1 Tax=Lachnellula occidentalis TaxID=215460 RepID=A0A8H8RLT2_9HELO|nr:hypothetical protein LOCC1_G006916 [Lachnellula occidentalis]